MVGEDSGEKDYGLRPSADGSLSYGRINESKPVISRRRFLGLAAGVGAGLIVAQRTGLLRRIGKLFEEVSIGSTEEQVKALEIFNNASADQKIFNATVIGVEDEGGKVTPLQFRKIPHAPIGVPEPGKGSELGKFKIGSVINEAIIIWAKGDPAIPGEPERYSRWYAFPDPKNPERIVFAWSGGISTGNSDKFFDMDPFDLETGEQSRHAPSAKEKDPKQTPTAK